MLEPLLGVELPLPVLGAPVVVVVPPPVSWWCRRRWSCRRPCGAADQYLSLSRCQTLNRYLSLSPSPSPSPSPAGERERGGRHGHGDRGDAGHRDGQAALVSVGLRRVVAFFDRLLQTAVFFADFFFFFLVGRGGARMLAEADEAERVAANADAKPAVGVTSRASSKAQTRLYALGDIRRAPFLRWGFGAGAGWAGLPPLPSA